MIKFNHSIDAGDEETYPSERWKIKSSQKHQFVIDEYTDGSATRIANLQFHFNEMNSKPLFVGFPKDAPLNGIMIHPDGTVELV